MGKRAGAYPCPAARQGRRSAEALGRGQSDTRQGRQSRPGAFLSLPQRLCRVLPRRLQDGDCVVAEGRSARSIRSESTGASLRKIRRSGASVGLLPQSPDHQHAWSDQRVCPAAGEGKSRGAFQIDAGGLSELERGTGIEPVTSSLGSSRSTAELTPLSPVGVQSVPSAQIASQTAARPEGSAPRPIFLLLIRNQLPPDG